MVTLGVSVMVAAVKFYEEGLGFPNMESPPTVAFFTLNGSGLGLYNRDSLDEDANISAEGSGFNDFALAHNVASRTEVKKATENAVSAGATLVKTPQKVFWGGYSGYIKDLDGHLWEVAYHPFFWIGPERA